MSQMESSEALVDLHLATVGQHSEFRTDERAREHVRSSVAAELAQASEVRMLRPDGILCAVVVLSPTRSRFDTKATRCRVEMRAGDSDALAWTADALQQLRSQFDPGLELYLDVAHEALLPRLADAGLRARMTLLHGAPRLCLDRLGPAPKVDLDRLGLRIEPLSSDAQIEASVSLRRSIFREDPELGYTSPLLPIDEDLQTRIDEYLRQQLTRALGQQLPTDFVVMRDDELVGHFGITLEPDHALLGRCGGFGIGFHRSVRGLGVGTLAYHVALRRLVELDVTVLRGMSANKAVLHLAQRMGRAVRGWKVELIA
jgi:hypothetical protein